MSEDPLNLASFADLITGGGPQQHPEPGIDFQRKVFGPFTAMLAAEGNQRGGSFATIDSGFSR